MKSILIVERENENTWKIGYLVRLLLRSFTLDWRVQIICPEGRRTQVEFWLLPYIRSGRVQLLLPDPALDYDDYDSLMKSQALWKSLYGDWVLIMTTGSGICPMKHKYTIEDYMCYDSIGAPMSKSEIQAGNKGFTLRRRETVLQVLSSPLTEDERRLPEHIFFDMKLKEMKATLPKLAISQQFAARKSSDIKKTPFAFSDLFENLDYEEGVKLIQEHCPEAAPLWNEWIDNDQPYSLESWPASDPDPEWV